MAPGNVKAAGKTVIWVGQASEHEGKRAMAIGIVKWFNPAKGYGFIEPEDGSKDVFVHISAVEKAGLSLLNEGQRVSYDLVSGQGGKTAADNLALND